MFSRDTKVQGHISLKKNMVFVSTVESVYLKRLVGKQEDGLSCNISVLANLARLHLNNYIAVEIKVSRKFHVISIGNYHNTIS